jgi:hypothetical protein
MHLDRTIFVQVKNDVGLSESMEFSWNEENTTKSATGCDCLMCPATWNLSRAI